MYILLLLIVGGLVDNTFSELRGQCPPVLDWEKCDGAPSNNCASDEDCDHQTKCCATACGRGCVKPLFTECEQAQMNAIHRARMLNPSDPPARIPLCNDVGEYEPIQCDPIRQLCWCVDDGGMEIPGTRNPNRDLVNCSEPRPCASHMCRMFCPFGFAKDPSGCPRCECYDPCSEIRCPNSLTCQLEDVPCFGDVCNPLPRCKKGRSLENICPYGRPLEVAGTHRPFLCGSTPEKPQCPPMYECSVQQNSEYGVCCHVSFKLQKPGTCAMKNDNDICGLKCVHDLECPMMQKCCESEQCGKHCSQPQNVTVCLQQKMLTELLIVNEKEGKGYVPQCSPESGQFQPRQCSRNGLVCWCVNSNGDKLPGTMGSGDKVQCNKDEKVKATGRSSSQSDCDLNICAQMCEYGFKVGVNGCPTCECDNPCDGFPCDEDKECIIMKDSACSGLLCSSYPVCQSKQKSSDPLRVCEGENCQTQQNSKQDYDDNKDLKECPSATFLSCNSVVNCLSDNDCENGESCCQSPKCGSICVIKNNELGNEEPRPQSMCEYLRDFSEKMEGTREGMSIALPPPKCNPDGTYKAMQCWDNECWCVDEFGTEIPRSRGNGTKRGCQSLREELSCLGLTCRLGCDFGFVMDQDTRCPLCECRNPCDSISCGPEMECLMVDVNCEDEYCSPVPACLPKKIGQCPYLIPMISDSCEFECKVDSNCNGSEKCCSNGCGTQCTEPVLMTACQHHRAIMQHMAHEAGIPARQMYMPACRAGDGGYEQVQCHPGLNQCWCVSESGEEIPETRVTTGPQLSCAVTPKCPMMKCEPCAYGYQIDSNGCRTCKCRDPCSEMACRGEGETCRMVKVNCISEPCPEVAMCLPRKDNPCMSGQPLVQEGTDSLVKCGPRDNACPSSHKCHLSPLDEYSVCCPKPRDVCFEPLNEGSCNNTVETRWRFNPEKNKCEKFTYNGCGGNQNNFYSENICRAVCPVLTQCERLRERNQKSAEKYKKSTFLPRCDPSDGSWESVQCLEAVGVCWCVNSLGHPVKGSLVRSNSPNCSSRQARRRTFSEEPEIEEFLKEVLLQPVEEVASGKDELPEQPGKTRCQVLQETITTYSVKCDEEGRFISTQCFNDLSECWCIDEAGNQLPNSKTFKRGTKFCMPTPIKEVEVTLGFHYNSLNIKKKSIETQIQNIMQNAGASILGNEMTIKINPEVIYVNFILIGSNKVDVAYNLEQQVKEGKVSLELGPGTNVVADITSSRFSHKLQEKETAKLTFTEHVISLEQREIVSESVVSVVTPYQTAIIVLTVSSAFIICLLVIVILLYRRKMSSKYDSSSLKCQAMDQRFLPSSQSIYVVSFPAKSTGRIHSASKGDNLSDEDNAVQTSSISSQVLEDKCEQCLPKK